MARFYRKRRLSRRVLRRSKYSRRRKGIKSLIRASKIIKKYSLPTSKKLIGMSEKKHLLLRVNYDFQKASFSASAEESTFQIILDPTLSRDMAKVFELRPITYKEKNKNPTTNDMRFFKYDYMKVKNIIVVIRPVVATPNTSINSEATSIFSPTDKLRAYPATPIYGYYTLKNPVCVGQEEDEAASAQYSVNPAVDRINIEGNCKTLFSFPSNKPITLVLNSLKFRTNALGPIVSANKLIDIQNLSATSNTGNKMYVPFKYDYTYYTNPRFCDEENEENICEFNNSNDEEFVGASANGVSIPSVNEQEFTLFFGRIVLRAQNNYQFSIEVIYDCDFYR